MKKYKETLFPAEEGFHKRELEKYFGVNLDF